MPRRNVEWDDAALRRRMLRAPQRIDAAMTAIINRNAGVAERQMKSRAPWTDRTGNARQGLHALPEREKLDYYMIVLAHAVSYGIWLEIRHNGRYEIINPTMRRIGDKTMRDASRLFEKVFR